LSVVTKAFVEIHEVVEETGGFRQIFLLTEDDGIEGFTTAFLSCCGAVVRRR
jgi:hypothetical protein